VLGEILILASEQVLLDEANGAEEPDGNTSEKKDEKLKPNPNPRVLTNETYATESAYTSMTTARLEAVKAATKPPLRSMFPPCFGVILWLLTFVSLRQRLF
jgi:coatomer subunit beta